MNFQSSSAPALPPKPESSDQVDGKIPWAGVELLARLWAGSGSLLDWLAPDWDVELEWNRDQVRARIAEVILLDFQKNEVQHLPRHAGDWLDAISQQILRLVSRTDMPTAHTDWQSTISEYGIYPSIQYVERQPIGTYNTPFTRLLKWTATAIVEAEALVEKQFGRSPLSSATRNRILCPLQLAEVIGASNQLRLEPLDIQACRSARGVWLPLTKLAEKLDALWFGRPTTQLAALKPLLPEFAHQLFELGTLGEIVGQVRSRVEGDWVSENPIAAVRGSAPCLTLNATADTFAAFYQTVPPSAARHNSTYRTLSKALGGGVLRPDIWLQAELGASKFEFVIECKFSSNPSYIASGIMQSMAYSVEFPSAERPRIHVAVGPEEIVTVPRAWNNKFVVASPQHTAELVLAGIDGSLENLMRKWSS